MHCKHWMMAGVMAVAGTIAYADGTSTTAEAAPAPAAAPALDLTFNGYFDMSYVYTDPKDASSMEHYGLDRFEIQPKVDFKDGLTAEAHGYGSNVNGDGTTGEQFTLEQAHITYTKDGASLMAGKWISKLGFEAYHSPDLYQCSYSATLVYPAAINGAALMYTDGKYFSVYAAALSGVWGSRDMVGRTDTDPKKMGMESQLMLMPVDGLKIQAGYATEKDPGFTEDSGAMYGSYNQSLVNIWSSYALKGVAPAGDILVAAEWNHVSDWTESGMNGDGWLAMINIPMCPKSALTLRTSALSVDDPSGGKAVDDSEFTVSPSVFITKRWTALAEFKTVSDKVNGDWNAYELESVVTF